MKNRTTADKKKLLREQDHLTVPPRLEGTVKKAQMLSKKKKKGELKKYARLANRQEWSLE